MTMWETEEKKSLVDESLELSSAQKDLKRRINQNLITISVIFIFIFTAYSGLQNIETSLNPDIGIYSLASITGGGLISCILAPTIISFIGAKGALVFASTCLGLFIAANFYPKTYFLLPAAILYGLSSGCMLTAQGTYVTTIAIEYAGLINERAESVISRFFGIFCMAFQSTQIWGNLLSSTILQAGGSSDNSTAPSNSSTKMLCGAKFCPSELAGMNSTAAAGPDKHLLNILLGVYLGLAGCGLIISLFFLKPISSGTDRKSVGIRTLLGSTLHMLVTETNMMLIVPIAMYSGVEQIVMYAYFTQAYAACELGIGWVGYTMICFGVVNTIFSPTNGILVKYIGRPPLLIFGFFINMGTLALLRFWTPDKSQLIVFFIIPGLWGMGDAIWQTQISALVGHVFPSRQEPAFANIRMFEAMGFMVVYLYSSYICQTTRLYIVAGWLTFSIILVLIVEVRIRLKVPDKYLKLNKDED